MHAKYVKTLRPIGRSTFTLGVPLVGVVPGGPFYDFYGPSVIRTLHLNKLRSLLPMGGPLLKWTQRRK